jgi:acylglycerol lipase
MFINQTLLFTREKRSLKGNQTVIIVHGIAEHSGRYEEMMQFFYDHHISSFAFDLRGHGQSAGERGKLKDYKLIIEDVHHIVNYVKKIYPEDQVFLLGHSLGGLISHMYAVTHQDVEGIITSGAPTGYIKDVLPIRLIGPKLIGWYSVKTNFADEKLSRIPSVEKDYINDPLNLKKMYGSLIGQMMVLGVRYLKKNIQKHQLPSLILHGEDDKIVPKLMSETMFERIPSKDKSLVIYPDAYHEIFNDLDKEKCLNDVVKWILDRKKEVNV